MLTPRRRPHFETFGFLVLRQLFTREEAATMREEAEDIFKEDRGGEPFPGTETQPFLSGVVADHRLYNIDVDLPGPDFLLSGTEGRLPGSLQRGLPSPPHFPSQMLESP